MLLPLTQAIRNESQRNDCLVWEEVWEREGMLTIQYIQEGHSSALIASLPIPGSLAVNTLSRGTWG